MASAVQNFSLPCRPGQARPFSPAASLDDGRRRRRRIADCMPGGAGPPLDGERGGLVRYHSVSGSASRGAARVCSPSPAAVRLFRFGDDDDDGIHDRHHHHHHHHPPLRPMSTSSSAPALPTAGSRSSTVAWAVAAAAVLSPSQTLAADAGPLHEDDKPRGDGHQPPADTATAHPSRPASSATSVWPWPPSPPSSASSAAQQSFPPSSRGGSRPLPASQAADAGPGRGRGRTVHRRVPSRSSSPPSRRPSRRASPPGLARSISVRWGPRMRHVSLSEVQAADDAVRAVAAQRRRHRLAWLLAGAALAGALSTAGAVTLAAAQAAAQAAAGDDNNNDKGPRGMGAGMLGWLVASLVVCVGAVLGLLALAATTRGWWRGRGRPWRAEQQKQQQTGSPARRSLGEGGAVARGKRWQQRRRLSGPVLGRGRTSSVRSQAWLEMDGFETPSGGPGAGSAAGADPDDSRRIPRLWRSWSAKAARAATRGKAAVVGATGNGGQSMAGPGHAQAAATVPDEDRNWAKFAGDPVQLRRYVESLEARVAMAEGLRSERPAGATAAAETMAADAPAPSPRSNTTTAVPAADHDERGPTPAPAPASPASHHPGRALTTGVLTTGAARQVRPQPSTDTVHTSHTTATTATAASALLPRIGGLAVGREPDDSANSLLLLLPRGASLSGHDIDFDVASGRVLEAVVAAAAAAAAGPAAAAGAAAPTVTPSATQSSILTQLYAAYAEERSPWAGRRLPRGNGARPGEGRVAE